jgi:uncharacterized protein (DUF1778 family)
MEKRTVNIGPIRVTPDEEKILKDAAERKESKLTAWIRKCALQASKRVTGAK